MKLTFYCKIPYLNITFFYLYLFGAMILAGMPERA